MDDIESISKVTLGPDDVVVVRTNVELPPDDCLVYMKRVESAFPDNRVLWVNMATTLDVVSPEQAMVIEEINRLHAYIFHGVGRKDGVEPIGKPPYKNRDGKPCNCTETRPGIMGTAEAGEPFDGKPLPSSVDRLKESDDELRRHKEFRFNAGYCTCKDEDGRCGQS